MSQASKDTRSAVEKARHTASIIGSLKHKGYVPNAEDEAIHQQAERSEITSEEAIAIFRERALDGLMLATDAADVSYREQRPKLQAARRVRDNRQRADLAHTQTRGRRNCLGAVGLICVPKVPVEASCFSRAPGMPSSQLIDSGCERCPL
jgi:hypothetical protein